MDLPEEGASNFLVPPHYREDAREEYQNWVDD